MLRNLIGFSAFALVLAACSQPESATEVPVKPSSEVADAAEVVSLPAVSPDVVAVTWTGPEINTGTNIEAVADGEIAILRRTGDQPDASSGYTTGANVIYMPPATGDLSGITLNISVSAKSASQDPAPFSVAYSTAKKGNSGWNDYETGTEFVNYSFDYLIPDGEDANTDVIGISVPKGSSIVVESISVSVTEAANE
jgi:hypothetical protein